jgi:hypothetical protein
LRAALAKFKNRPHSIDTRHREIQYHRIEIQMSIRDAQALPAVTGQQHRGIGSGLPQQGSQPLAQDRMIVDDQELHRANIVHGMFAAQEDQRS